MNSNAVNPDTAQAAPQAAQTGRHLAWWGGYALLLLLAPLLLTSSLSQSLLSQMGIAIIICLSYNLLLGQGGLMSFGHAVYSGMGAFLAIHTLNWVSAGWPLPVSLVPLVGGCASLLLALLLGWVSTRRAGTPFAMITFGMGELIWALALVVPGFFGGEAGISGNRVAGGAPLGISFGPQIQLYYLIALYTFVCTALLYALTLTPLGRLLNAVRDNPERVAFVGYNPQRVRYLAFAIAAFFAGIGGGLSALHFESVSAGVFSAQRSGLYLLFTFLGGAGFFFGPIIGAVLMVLIQVLLPALTPAWLLYLGLIFVAMVMYAPGGLAAWLVQLRPVRSGWWWRGWAPALGLAFSGLLALGGLVLLVEMTYHLQQSAALGSNLRFAGLLLDTQSPACWFGASAALLLGGGLMAWQRRRLLERGQQMPGRSP